ncbi:MAG: aminotransferase class V-fold PLP-dependent enzyme, partial [Sphingopyxis sp.]|nr:aminotransferase class V-fold PLP-dependent enzyme [Sphingopyxis sp.]
AWSDAAGRVGFGHRRLAIIDLDPRADQPMVSHDRRFAVVFNGEIYNHAALRRDLVTGGCRFQTRSSDTEVLIEGYRARAARLIGGSPDDVALVPSASYGVAVAARNLPVGPRQNLVVLGQQFPSNYYAWTAKADAVGAAVRVAQRDFDDDWTAAVLAAIDADTAVVSVPQCHWADGRLVDLVKVGAACRAVGAALVLDLTQSIGRHAVRFGGCATRCSDRGRI